MTEKLREVEGVTAYNVFNYNLVCVGQTLLSIYLKNKSKMAEVVLKTAMKDIETYQNQQVIADVIQC